MFLTVFLLSQLISREHEDSTILTSQRNLVPPSLVQKISSILNMKNATSLVMFMMVPLYQTSWYPTSRKVAGSIPDGVIGIFHWRNPSGHTMALGSTQPLTEMSTRNISWGVKAASVYGWQPYDLHVPTVLKSGSLSLLEPSGPVQACNGIALPFTFTLPWYP